MDFIKIHTIQNLGIAIFHSLWQIGIVAFIYLYFILIRKKLSVNHKYTAGLICFVLVLVSFVFTLHIVKNLNSSELPISSDNLVQNITEDLNLTNLPENEIFETQNNSGLFGISSFKFRQAFNRVAGAIGTIWILGFIFFALRKIFAFYSLKSIKNNKHNVRSIKWQKVLKEISANLNLKKHVEILFSPFVNSPLSFGFLKPVILFPLRLTTGLSNEG